MQGSVKRGLLLTLVAPISRKRNRGHQMTMLSFFVLGACGEVAKGGDRNQRVREKRGLFR